jgi:type II secretory pathway component PulJ
MVDHKPSAVESAVLSGVHAATSITNALRTPMNREQAAHTTANALRTPMNREQAAHTTAKRAQGAACSHGPVGRRLHKKCLQNGSQSRGYSACFTLKQRGRSGGFTLAELLVSVGVLVLLVLLFTQLVNSAATITILGHKRMDADSEARQVFDRMAIDFAQIVKRSDVDSFAKNTKPPNSDGQPMDNNGRNDQIAFYSSVPGYYPPGSQSPVSLVAYRVNSDSNSSSYNKLERLGKGLVWNGASTTDTPVVFMPLTISATWPAATSSSASDTAYEVIGPDVFRFEYYYLLTPPQSSGFLSSFPCSGPGCTGGNDWHQVTAIVVDIAVIDPRSKVLLNPSGSDIATLNVSGTNFLADFTSDQNQPGKFLNKWQTKLNGITTLPSGVSPRQTISGVRVYERYFYLSQ